MDTAAPQQIAFILDSSGDVLAQQAVPTLLPQLGLM